MYIEEGIKNEKVKKESRCIEENKSQEMSIDDIKIVKNLYDSGNFAKTLDMINNILSYRPDSFSSCFVPSFDKSGISFFDL